MAKAKRILAALLSAVCVFSTVSCAGNPPADTSAVTDNSDAIDISKYNLLSVEEYKDKTLAGHIAQYVGFLSGYEFARDSSGNIRIGMPDSWFEICNGPYADPNSKNKHSDKLLKNDETGLWEVWNDDDFSIDILNQYIIADMYEDYGTITTKSITDGWVNYNVYDMGGGHRTYGAYGLAKNKGYLSPYLGMREFGNLYGVNGEPYIANETLGMTAAGLPSTANDLADMFGSVTSDMDPVLWARFFATMYSLAYFESDIPTLIEEARKTLPEGCVVQEVIDEVYALRAKYPTLAQWREAAKEADQICHRNHYDLDTRMGETSINCSFILIGLLWGEGDFYETCRIISLAGHGGDSTTPVGLGIVAVANGFDCIPQEALDKTWQDGQGVVVNLAYPGADQGYWMCALGLDERIKMADVVDLYQKNFESILAERGGFERDGYYYIPKDELGSVDTVIYENFESGKLGSFTSIGSTSMASAENTYMGNYGLQINASESADTGAYVRLTGLREGEVYRYSAYVYTATKLGAYLFARSSGEDGLGQYASVYDTTTFVYREFVFTATSETMEIGVMIPSGSGSHKYAVVDDICVMRVRETRYDNAISIVTAPEADGSYKEGFCVKVEGKIKGEVYLKVRFSNSTGKVLDGKLTVGGAGYGTVPFYKTGPKLSTEAYDVTYIPVVLSRDTNTVFVNTGTGTRITVYDVSIVTVCERFN